MIARRRQATIVPVGIVTVMLVAGAVTPARAAPHPTKPAAARLAAAVSEGAKVTLNDTSIAGPAFDGNLAWAGTDVAHHLNVRLGTGGLAFPTKTTLPETSPFSPAITLEPSEGPVTNLEIAWTGSDPGHHLNVEFLSIGSTTSGSKQTLSETSIGAPAILFNGNLLLAWTGTDPNHSLNVLQLAGPQRGQKTVLRQFSSDAGPSLAETGTNELVLGWSVRRTQRLNLATSTDGGVHFTSELGAGLPETSAAAPQFTDVTNAQGQPGQPCIAWTGTDPAHHLNVQCTAQFPQFPDPAHTKTVLPETALGAPGFGASGRGEGEIAWTGTDPAHHLNVAQLTLP